MFIKILPRKEFIMSSTRDTLNKLNSTPNNNSSNYKLEHPIHDGCYDPDNAGRSLADTGLYSYNSSPKNQDMNKKARDWSSEHYGTWSELVDVQPKWVIEGRNNRR